MKKYLFIVPSLSKGGAEKVVSVLANKLVEKKRKVTIITHFHTNNDYYTNKDVKIVCLSNLFEEEYRKRINPLYLLKLLKELRNKILVERADFIIPFLFTTCFRVEFALMFSKEKKKVIQTIRNNPQVYPSNIFCRLYRNYLVKKSIKTIVQNEEQKKYFNKKNYAKIFVLPNPVDDRIFEVKGKIKNEMVNIIGVGRLEEQKNFSLLIDAFYEIYKVHKNVRLFIYGDGSLRHKLNEQIKDKKIENVAFLKGRIDRYDEIYGNADIFVLSSTAEGMPNALLEAMAVGISCVSTNCPTGPSEIIKNNKNGILVESNNLSQMKEAIENLIMNKTKMTKISKYGKEYILENYSSSKITKKLINICETY